MPVGIVRSSLPNCLEIYTTHRLKDRIGLTEKWQKELEQKSKITRPEEKNINLSG
jgi:hypothetical protein